MFNKTHSIKKKKKKQPQLLRFSKDPSFFKMDFYWALEKRSELAINETKIGI